MGAVRMSWHSLTQFASLLSIAACGGHSEKTETMPATPERSEEGVDARGADPLETLIRVSNGSAGVRSRYSSCSGSPYQIGVRPASAETVASPPTCSPIDCATLAPNANVPVDSECAAPACADIRIDFDPGTSDQDYVWEGVYASLTERNCYDSRVMPRGTPMLARICFGEPGDDLYSMKNFECEDHPFDYGDAVLDIALQ